jgi:hypothetical protein
MPTPSDTCPKCQAKMCDGFVVAYGGVGWYPGPAIKSFWRKFTMQRSELRPIITANRCEHCGFIEFYAP